MRAVIKNELRCEGSRWFLEELRGAMLEGYVAKDGDFVADDGTILMPEEYNLLPEDSYLFALRCEVEFVQEGELIRVTRAENALPHGAYVDERGYLWLRPWPYGCNACGCRTVNEQYEISERGDKLWLARESCDYCGEEVCTPS